VAVLPHEALPGILSGDLRWRSREYPEDAEIVSVHYDPARCAFLVLVASESFSPVFAGDLVPEMEFYLERTKPAGVVP
jgi:hypothetical protein